MAELSKDRDQTFWDMVASNELGSVSHDKLGIDEASHDNDLVALFELRVLYETTAVSPKRAEQIEEMIDDKKEADYLQLIGEVQRKFALTDEEMKEALFWCEQYALDKKQADTEWIER